jgi:uncharacterized protein YqgV (UPF0045/DUF77 family)
MVISAQISIYSLRQQRLTPAIEGLWDALKRAGLHPELGPMSTTVVGEDEAVFGALREAFNGAAGTGHVVMAVTFSNACPV